MVSLFRTVFLVGAFSIAAIAAEAQVVAHPTDTVKKPMVKPMVQPKPKGPKPITHEMSGGLRLNTNGWSLFTNLGKVKSKDPRHSDMFYNARLLELEFTEKKDPRETKTTSTNGGGGNTYIYGKINNFYALKLGWGYRRLLVGKPDPGSVSMHWANTGGFSLGLLKPYYLNTLGDPNAIKYSDNNKSTFLYQNLIEGSAGFSKGLGEIKFVPGFHFKSALHFDFSTNRKTAIGVETGVNIEYYTQAVQIMATQSPNSAFLDLFIAIEFGKRW